MPHWMRKVWPLEVTVVVLDLGQVMAVVRRVGVGDGELVVVLVGDVVLVDLIVLEDEVVLDTLVEVEIDEVLPLDEVVLVDELMLRDEVVLVDELVLRDEVVLVDELLLLDEVVLLAEFELVVDVASAWYVSSALLTIAAQAVGTVNDRFGSFSNVKVPSDS